MDGSHFEPLISYPCVIQPVLYGASAEAPTMSRIRRVSTPLADRSARPKALRVIADLTHSTVG